MSKSTQTTNEDYPTDI